MWWVISLVYLFNFFLYVELDNQVWIYVQWKKYFMSMTEGVMMMVFVSLQALLTNEFIGLNFCTNSSLPAPVTG